MVSLKVSQREIIQDIRSGMDETAICRKYNISLKGLQSVYDKLIEAGLLGKEIKTQPRKLNLLAVLADIRGGMNSSELRKKYGLTDETLRQVVKKLLAAEGKRSAADGPETLIEEPAEFLATSEFVRHEVDFDLPVYEADRPDVFGMVRDVSEGGMSVAGIEARQGDIKTLVVLGDELGQVSSFEFEGCCRWAFVDSVDGACLAGFAIEKISRTDAQELQKLVRLITTGG
jgi:Mor family transcriptional regulator